MSRKIFLFGMVIASTQAAGAANDAEHWKCHNRYNKLYPITLTANIRDDSGTIQPKGLPEQNSYFYIDGINRRWNWINSINDDISYSFIISSGGDGSFFIFTDDNPTVAKQFFSCKKIN